MKYILEPMLFALDDNISERDFKVYVNRLILWDKWLSKYPNDVYVLSDTTALLNEMMYFPIYPRFDALMKKYKINYVQAGDLNQMINRLLTKAKKIDYIGDNRPDDDVIFIDLKLDKVLDAETYPGKLKDAFEQMLWYLYCQCRRNEDKIDTFVVFGKNLTTNVTLSVEYQTIEEEDDDIKEVLHTDKVNVYCRSSLAEFFKDSNTPETILRQTDSKEDLSLAIRVAVYQSGNLKKVADSFDKFDFVIQDSFIKDFRDAHYADNSTIKNRLMEEISNVLLNEHLENREDWRIDKGANSGQETKNGYLAWRWFITRSVKMMYWQKEKHYKFANVKEHDIFVCRWED